MGGIWFEIKKGLEGEEEGIEEKGLIVREIKWGRNRWKIGTVYIRERMGRVLEKIKMEVEEKGGEKEQKKGERWKRRIKKEKKDRRIKR